MSTPFMSVVLRRRVILALVGALALPAALPLGTATASHFSNTEELSATDNVGAAIAYSASTFPDGADEAVLGRDDAFADSLASGMLQATRPLLLTASAELSEPTKAELARLAVTTVHVLGGEQAITPAVVTALEAEGYTVQRHSGPTRIDTAVEVAKALGAAATKAIIARAFGSAEDETRAFADSLSAGGWAAGTEMPVLLTETEKLSEATATYLKASAIKEVFVVGGQGAINETVVTQLTALGLTVKRVSGPTRFHTALAIASERGFTSAGDAEKVIVTEGQAPDAWAAGFAAAGRAAKDNAPIVLAVGAEIPEPTMTFLTGQAPTEEPTEEPTTDPTEEPTTDPTEEPTGEPTPDPSESPSEEPAPEGIASLLCAPMLATEACDAAATALGQIAGAGPQHVEFAVAAIGRYDHAVGKVAEPKSVNGLSVTGCGYTDEPIFIEDDGTFYLMLAGDPGTCAAEFTLAKSAGPVKQTVEFNVGEDFTPPSVLGSPELVAVRPVKSDEEGVHLRFVFDEPVAPSPAINPSNFNIYDYDGTWTDSRHQPSAVQRDPRNPRAVLAVFSSAIYNNSTVAVAKGGFVCEGIATSPTSGPCTDAKLADKASNGDWVIPGAVRDLDKLPNPTGHFGLRTLDRTGSKSDAPDLLSVGDYQASDQSLLFTFSEDVKLHSASQPVAAATVLLKDGTIKSSDINGWRAGPTPDSLRVTFTGDGLSAADMENARRAFVKHSTKDDKTDAIVTDLDGNPSTPVAVIIAGGGISDRPDFVNIESPQLTGPDRKVTFVFEEDLDTVDPGEGPLLGKFVAVLANGKVAYPELADDPPTFKGGKRKIEVRFHEPEDDCTTECTANKEPDAPGVALDNTVMYFTVLTGAVTSFTQKTNFADTIQLTTPIIYGPGRTKAPDLTEVSAKHTEGEVTTPGIACTDDKFVLQWKFDASITIAGSPKFDVWYMAASTTTYPGGPRVTRLDGSDSIAGEPSGSGSIAEKKYQHMNDDDCPAPDTASQFSGAPAAWGENGKGDRVKYLSVEAEVVSQTVSGTGYGNYAAGMAVPN